MYHFLLSTGQGVTPTGFTMLEDEDVSDLGLSNIGKKFVIKALREVRQSTASEEVVTSHSHHKTHEGTRVVTADTALSLTRYLNDDNELSQFQLPWIASSTTHQCQMLSESHLAKLFTTLRNHATKWRDIGMHLGFVAGELDNIQGRPLLLQGAPESWLGAMLTDWLRRSSDDSCGGPTLDNLKLALCKSGLGAVSNSLTLSHGH